MVSMKFFIEIIFPAELWLWGDLAFNRNEYQKYFLGGKGGWCIGLTNHIHVPIVLKSVSLVLLET